MIKFKAKLDDKPLYGFGLSFGNLRLLKEGKPIVFDFSEMGGEGKIVIFVGETDQSMVDDLKNLGIVDENTEMRELE